MDIDLKFATTEEDRADVYRFRYKLYVEEQGLFKKVADHERRFLTDEYDEKSHILIARMDGETVGTARITWGADTTFTQKTRDTYEFEHFAGAVDERDIVVATRLLVRQDMRGGMLAFQLIWTFIEFCAKNNVELILGNCEPHLLRRYGELGFRPYGGMSNHTTNGILVSVAIVTGDLDYLRAIKSPMLIPLSLRTAPSTAVERLKPLVGRNTAVLSAELSDKRDYVNRINQWVADVRGVLKNIMAHDEEALVMLAKSHVLDCKPTFALIRKGHVSRTLYILLSGTLNVLDNGKRVARVTQPGSLVGEVAFFSGGRRMSDVVAGPKGARVLALSASTLNEVINNYSATGAKFLHFTVQQLCDKLLERARGAPEETVPPFPIMPEV